MADYCDYEIHVRGTKKAALMVYATMRSADEKEIRLESGTDEKYVIHFRGCCRWDLDVECDKTWDGNEVDFSNIDEKSMREEQGIEEFTSYPLADMSAMFHCEIEVYAGYQESGSNSFIHYKDGDTLDEQYAAYPLEPDDDGDFPEDYCPDEPADDLSTLFDF